MATWIMARAAWLAVELAGGQHCVDADDARIEAFAAARAPLRPVPDQALPPGAERLKDTAGR